MKKVIVIGCPGSGKSTFSKKLHQKINLPLFHLDQIYWNADKTIVESVLFRERLLNILQKPEWIIDGNYSSTMEWRWQVCDTVIFLDYPVDVCLKGVRERKGKKRSDLPWVETEDDEVFLEYIKQFSVKNRPQIMALIAQYTDKEVYVFKKRSEAERFLNQL